MTLPKIEPRKVDILLERLVREGKLPNVTGDEREAMRRVLAEGIRQGMLQDERESVFNTLEDRFGGIPAEIVEAILAVDDLVSLRALGRRADVVDSLAEFRALMTP